MPSVAAIGEIANTETGWACSSLSKENKKLLKNSDEHIL
jgi:hypothetical protein